MNSFSPQKWKVNTCFMWSGYSVFRFTDTLLAEQVQMTSPPYEAKIYESHTITCIHNTACQLLNCCTYSRNRLCVCFNLFILDFLVTLCLVVAVQPCMEWIPIKKNSELLTKNCKKPNSLTKIHSLPIFRNYFIL